MWMFLTARLRQWVIFALVFPVLLRILRTIRQSIEKRSGRSRLTRALAKVEELGRRPDRRR